MLCYFRLNEGREQVKTLSSCFFQNYANLGTYLYLVHALCKPVFNIKIVTEAFINK